MHTPPSSETIFFREEGRRARESGLPPDLLVQSARRLRILALLYAFVFFMAGVFPALPDAESRARYFSTFVYWGPSAISIAMALLVALFTHSPRLPVSRVMTIGLVFEVASSFGIAAAEFVDPTGLSAEIRIGLSWVAPWVLLFTVVVPSPPRKAIIATLASLSAVPIVAGSAIQKHAIPGLTPEMFFFGLVLPYLLVAVMAYVGTRVVYALGREVTRAREMGGYRLIELLGKGGMGEVWRAEHHLLARPAAIKLVRFDNAESMHGGRHRELRERFEREAQATALMRSPHTVDLYDFGMANDGTFYYVMELLDGFDLEALVKRFGPVPAERVVHMLIQACHSLGDAHAQGVIHRDVKPANVFVCRYGREVDFVKVLDFGMVKSQQRGENAETQLTGEHAVAGTPAYMAPELVLGSNADGRADLYALGCVAYWLVTGQMVFTGKTVMEIMVQHTHAEPVPPSKHTELDVPPALEAIILSCLAKKPDDRPDSADALAEALASVPLTAPWTRSRAHDWWDRHHPALRVQERQGDREAHREQKRKG